MVIIFRNFTTNVTAYRLMSPRETLKHTIQVVATLSPYTLHKPAINGSLLFTRLYSQSFKMVLDSPDQRADVVFCGEL